MGEKRKIRLAGSLLGFIVAHLFWLATCSEAQKIYRIGSLNTSQQFTDSFTGFRIRMNEMGYREEQNVRYDFYDAKGRDEALNEFARKMVQDKADLIVTSSTTATIAAAKATAASDIPVVFLSVGNPQKFIKNFASSGNNLAGISAATVEITSKRFELLRELTPWVKRVAALSNSKGVNFRADLDETQEAAKKLGLTLWEVEATGRREIAKIVPNITRKRVDAIYSPPDATITEAIDLVVEQAIKQKLPLITSLYANVKRGCLATYAADYFSLGQQGAVIATKILSGARPADLPIEMPSKWKLVINRKTANLIGLKIPKQALIRADELID